MPTTTSYTKFWILPVVGWLAFSFFHGWLTYKAGFNFIASSTDSLVSNSILALICTGSVFAIRNFRPKPEHALYLIIVVFVLAMSWNWLNAQILKEILKDEIGFTDFLDHTNYIRLFIGFLVIVIFVLAGWISYYINITNEEQSRIQEIARISKESELNNLRQQLQPHFLFNTLNSISALLVTSPEQARKMIQQLSDFLRGTLKKEDQQLETLSDEMDHLKLYLEIEKIRFGNRLITEFRIAENTQAIQIPSLLLQPLVENAIKFGLYDTLDEVLIEIKAWKEEYYLIISISNPFDAQTSKPAQGTGFGLSSVSRRLYLIFGRNDLLETKGQNGKFTVLLKIPTGK